jgi:hypothetical protein
MRMLSGWVLAVMVIAAPPGAAAQEAAIAGHVVDQTRMPLPGVTVEATSADRTISRSAVTDRAGAYRLAVPAGRYRLVFSAMNFADVRRDVTISSGTVPIDVTMQLSLNAAVVVTGVESFRNLADLANPEESLVGVAAAASEGAVTARQIRTRPIMRAGELLETVPGVIISQHSGEGKANQYYLRGFNLDHGTDFSTTVAGLPVNLPTHAHGQGYSDLNFLIPELVSGVQFKKGPYSAQDGDFSAAGSANVNYASSLPEPAVSVSVGQHGWGRFFAAASPRVAGGTFLTALELNRNDGPWDLPDRYRRLNGVLRYSRGDARNAFSVTGLFYSARWNATDQVPARAVESGQLSRFGHIDPSDGGRTARYSVVAELQRTSVDALTRVTAYASKYRLNLFSNFTFVLDDPVNGDQFEQADRRWVTGGRLSHTRKIRVGSRTGEGTVGLQLRNDSIPVVGLYHTQARQRLATTREDDVVQTSVGAFVDHELRWLPWLRTTGGVRLDGYRFSVSSNDPANSGRRRAALVSPKGGAILGPWKDTELYVNAGLGYHSNDARGATTTRDPKTGEPAFAVTPLVRATGAEAGVRSVFIPRVQTTVALWRLDLDSELLFVGDAGTTEASRPSERYGIEWTNYARIAPGITVDGDIAWSRARFADADPAGRFIPGAAETVV